MANNPWEVESIKDFYFLKCPECDFNTKEKNSFENHATENHPLSFVLFNKKYAEEDFNKIDIKEDPLSQSDTQIPYDDQKTTINNLFPFYHFEGLSDEIILAIFSLLDIKGVLRCGQVSKRL